MSTPPPTAAASPAPVPARGPLRRQRVGRRIGGVAVGVAQHLGIKTSTARWAFVLTAPIGIGLVMYLWLWLLVPTSDATGPPPALARLAPLLNNPERRAPAMRLVAGLVCLFAAALVAAAAVGVKIPWQWLFPGFALLGGIALAWSQLDRTDAAAGRGPVSWLRLGAALALMVLGIALMVSQGRGPMSLLFALLAGLAVLASVAVLLAPWWLRLWSALGSERAARAREAERADLAAHLHDSVLQTLAVIRSQADDPDSVRRLARAQERELREWLYHDRPKPGESLAAELKTAAAEVEDASGVEVGVVIVGDRPPDEALGALVSAAREALLNATRHGAPPVSLYAEISPTKVEVFIRDKGDGFVLDQVPSDRLGVRESILGRVRRQGGQAEVTSKPGHGTEVRLSLGQVNSKERS